MRTAITCPRRGIASSPRGQPRTRAISPSRRPQIALRFLPRAAGGRDAPRPSSPFRGTPRPVNSHPLALRCLSENAPAHARASDHPIRLLRGVPADAILCQTGTASILPRQFPARHQLRVAATLREDSNPLLLLRSSLISPSALASADSVLNSGFSLIKIRCWSADEQDAICYGINRR